MRKGIGVVGLAVMLGGGAAFAQKIAPEKKPPATAAAPIPQMDPQAQAMMAEMQKLGAPGPEHKALMPLVGSFTAQSKFFMPGQKPMETVGTAEVKSILGGRFVEQVFTGTMFGQAFEGRGVVGYDNAKKKYVWGWIDSMSTALLTAEGTADATGKVITFKGETYDPQTKKMAPVKYIIRIESDKKHAFESWEMVGGKETKTMEVNYARK